MDREPVFTPIDLQTWKRGQIFYYFSKMAPTGYSLTVDMDVTKMKTVLKKANLKFFPAYTWLVTKTLNLQQEFRIAEKDGQIGYYDFLTPLYASFHEEDKTFSFMWTTYNDSFKAFYNAYENKSYFFPSIEAGGFSEVNGRIIMPLSITCHHAATDGYHVNCFLKALQLEADSFEKYLDI